MVPSHIECLTYEQQYQPACLQSQERRPFCLIDIDATSLVELATTDQTVTEFYHCFVMTQVGRQPLPQCPDDTEPLSRHYLQRARLRLNRSVPEVDEELPKGAWCHVWLSNIRKLINVVGFFVVGLLPLVETVNLQLHSPEPTPSGRWVDEYERQIITEAFNIHQRCVNKATEYLQVPHKKLYLRMRKHGLSKEHYKL